MLNWRGSGGADIKMGVRDAVAAKRDGPSRRHAALLS